jgi:hypothetical protein
MLRGRLSVRGKWVFEHSQFIQFPIEGTVSRCENALHAWMAPGTVNGNGSAVIVSHDGQQRHLIGLHSGVEMCGGRVGTVPYLCLG